MTNSAREKNSNKTSKRSHAGRIAHLSLPLRFTSLLSSVMPFIYSQISRKRANKRKRLHSSCGLVPSILLRLTFVGISMVFLTGCATDVANRYYASGKYPSKSPNLVEILRKNPSRPFEVIADFQSKFESPESVRMKAAQIGADAVIISTPGGSYNTTDTWASNDSLASSGSRICGTAIVYK